MRRCPKCGSSMIYADDDFASGDRMLACKMCGKRWRPKFKPYTGLEEEMAAKLSPEVIEQAKTHVLALGIKQSGGNPDTAGIIAAIDMQIIHHQNIIDKLTEAKNILI